MKQFISFLWLGLLISSSHMAHAQFGQVEYCDDFDPLTFTSTTATWDWRDDTPSNWMAYIRVKPIANTYLQTELQFPFRPQSGNQYPNVAHLNTNTLFDYAPSDGWELIFRAFGVGPSASLAVENPTFVLYNRFRGILRVFVWLTVDPGQIATEAAVTAEFESPGVASTLFSLMESPTHAVEGFDKSLSSTTLNEYNNTVGGEWLFADIPVAYDPCTCGESQLPNDPSNTQLNIGEIMVKGSVTAASVWTNTDPTGVNEDVYNNDYGTNVSAISQIEKGNKFIKSINSLIGVVNEQNSKTNAIPNGDGGYYIKTSKPIKIPSWMKVLPYAGDVFVVLDALLTGGEAGDKDPTANIVTPTQVTFSGNLSVSGNVLPTVFYTPGSPYDDPSITNADPLKKPIYDHVLGIFNLVESPKLEYTTYQPVDPSPNSYQCINTLGQNQPGMYLPPVRQYHLANSLSYAVNPASELELIGLDIAIQYQLGANQAGIAVGTDHLITYQATGAQLGLYGPVPSLSPRLASDYSQKTYEERLNSYGIDIAFWPSTTSGSGIGVNDVGRIIYTTDFFPAQCSDKLSIFLAVPESTDPRFSGYNFTPEITLKVRAILRRIDTNAGAETEDVIFMATYKLETESVPGGGTYSINSNPTNVNMYCSVSERSLMMRDYSVTNFSSSLGNQAFFPIGGNGLPFDLTIENTQINTGTFEALQSISVFNTDFIHTPTTLVCDTIGGQVICGNAPQDPIVLRAGRRISIDPDGLASSDIGPGTTMIMELPERFNGCDADPMPSPATSAEIQAICQDGNKYNPVIASRQEALDTEIVEKLPSIPLTAQPNPFTDELTLSYELPAEAQVQMQLVDMMGRPVRQILPGSHRKAGQHEMQVNLSDLASGMYTVILQVGEMRQTVKVVKR